MPSPWPARRVSGPGRSRRPGGRSQYARVRTARGRIERATGRPASRTARDRGRDLDRLGNGFTARAAVLGLVGCALVLALVFPTKEYLGQRSQLAALRQQEVDAEQRVALLTEQARQLKDPAYVRALARKRLQYVMPGDTVYLVIDPKSGTGDPAAVPQPAMAADPTQPWYRQLWRSVQTVDRAPDARTPAPDGR